LVSAHELGDRDASASDDYAAILQMAGLAEYRFKAAAFLKLQGRGIRELTIEKDWIWGIAGGPEDGKDNFVLWKMPRAALQANAILSPTIVRALPASSEGLEIVGETAYVLIDAGEWDKGSEGCKVPARYLQCDLPCQEGIR
jgi:hypothetical protein